MPGDVPLVVVPSAATNRLPWSALHAGPVSVAPSAALWARTRELPPRRVLLAAGDSAADVSFSGDELLGFVSALLATGTAGLVASLVAVGDVETGELMRGLHGRLIRGESMAAALHGARSELNTLDDRQS